MATLAKLVVELSANSAALVTEMQKAQRTVAQVTGQMKGSLAQLQSGFALATRAAGFFGIALSVKEAAEFVKHNIQTVGALGETAEQLGITTDMLQSMQYAATQSGISTEQLEASISKFSQRIGDAAAGGNEAVMAFRNIGVGILDAGNKLRPTEAILLDVASALSGIDDPARRAAAVVDLFGRTSQKLLPLLSGGAAGIRKFVDEAKSMGLVIGADSIKKADDVSDAWARLGLVAEKTGQRISVALIPALNDVTKLMESIAGIETPEQKLDRLQKTLKDLNSANFGGGKVMTDRIKSLREEIARLQEDMSDANLISARMASRGGAAAGTHNPQTKAEIETEKARAKAVADLVERLHDEADALTLTGQASSVAAALKSLHVTMTEKESRAVTDAAIALGNAKLAQEGYQAAQRQAIDEGKRDDAARKAGEESVKRQISARYGLMHSMQEEVANNQALIDAMGMSRDAYERLRIEQQLIADARGKGAALSQDEAAAQAAILVDQKHALDAVTASQEDLKSAGMDVFNALGNAADDLTFRYESMAKTAMALVQDLYRAFYNLAVTKPFERALSSAIDAGGAGGLLGFLGLGGPSVGADAASAFYNPTGYAEGTDSAAPGWHMVGERGPELVNFGKGGGTVLTSGQTADVMAGGGDIHVHLTVQTGVAQTVRTEMTTMLPQITSAVAAAVADKAQRGGRYGRAIRG